MENLDFYGTVLLSLLIFVGLFGLISCQLYSDKSGEVFAYIFLIALAALLVFRTVLLIFKK